jgi:predicted signal transduction protein with EAL and GGDEF domain
MSCPISHSRRILVVAPYLYGNSSQATSAPLPYLKGVKGFARSQESNSYNAETCSGRGRMTSTQANIRLGMIAGAGCVITFLGIISMVSVSQSNKRRHETETLLYQLEANAQGLGSNEWEAIAQMKVDSDVHQTSQQFRRDILTTLKMIHAFQDREGLVDKVQTAASKYLTDIDQEFALISNGHIAEARELDDLRVDPDFDLLDHSIHEAIATFETKTEHGSRTELLSSVGILLGSLAALLFLTFHFERGRNLQKTNSHLQQLVTQLSRSEEKLIHTAYHDLLTQLPNRTFFMDRLTQCLKRTKRHDDYKFAVVFVDVDQFKNVNDSLGHAVGDQLIVEISKRLTASIRRDDLDVHPTHVIGSARSAGNDILARYGGDEFAIVLDDIRDPSDGIRVAERIRQNLAAPFLLSGHQLQITVSTGIAVSATGYSAAEEALRDADTAMHQAKAQGKSQYLMCDPTMHAAAVNRLKLEDDLRGAANRGELQVYYQPIVSLHDGRLGGFEALLRWQRPDCGLVPPGQFIPVAEETGLIVAIGSWMLKEACIQMHDWHLRFPLEPGLTIAVNFSAKQFIQPDLVAQVDQVLRESRLDPRSLNIEFTESVAMQDPERTALALNELKALGVGSSIDDFGTGYSSLGYLSRLSLDILKLDRTFISEMENNNESRKIARAIISLAHNLGMDVVAEGIETGEQAKEVRSLGCKYAQGYFFSKPINSASVEALLRSGVRGADFVSHMKSAFNGALQAK